MDIKNKRLKIKCENCSKDFYLTFNTTQCPNCGIQFNPNDVHKIFYDYESHLANSNLYRFEERMEKSGESIEKTGNAIQQIGCFIFMIPLGLFCIWLIITML